MESKKYHNIRLLKAWKECTKFLKDHIVPEFIFIGITTIANICVASIYQEIVRILLYEFEFLAIAFMGLFLWKSLRVVPERIYKENQKTIDSLRGEIESSKKQQESKLQIEVQGDGNAYFNVIDEEGHDEEGFFSQDKRQILSINIHSERSIDDVKIFINKIESSSVDNEKLQNILPVYLGFKDVDTDHPVSFSTGQTRKVDVVSYLTSQGNCELQLEQSGKEPKPKIFILELSICKIEIKVTGKNTNSIQQDFEVFMKDKLEYRYDSSYKQRIFMKRI